MEKRRKQQTNINGPVKHLTQIGSVHGDVIINRDMEDCGLLSLSSLIEDSITWPDGEFADPAVVGYVQDYLNGIGYVNAAESPEIHATSDVATLRRVWKSILEVDTLHRRSRDSFVEGQSGDPPPKGHVASWVGSLLDTEFALAQAAAEIREFDEYNSIAEQAVGQLWAPSQELLDSSGQLTSLLLYARTRNAVAHRRFQRFGKEMSDPFEHMIPENNSCVPLGIAEDGRFIMANPRSLGEEGLLILLSTPPMLAADRAGDLKSGTSMIAGDYVSRYPKQRLDARVAVLNLQVLAAKIALLRHLGYWSHVIFMHELLATSFDPHGLARLLDVGGAALRQLRILNQENVQNTRLRCPSFDIANVSFDHDKSIWFQENPIRVTQMLGLESANKCIHPIIDFQLINYGDAPCIINEFIFQHFGAWSEIKAAPVYGVLESAHTYEVPANFDAPLTTFPLDPPLYIAPKSPARFKVMLRQFVESCPGTDAFIQFGFRGNHEICDSQIFHMDIRGFGSQQEKNREPEDKA